MQKIPRAKTVKKKYIPGMVEVSDEAKIDVVAQAQARRKMQSLSDSVAQDTFYYKNYYYPGGKEAFQKDVKLQSVDKYYPYALGGPLFVDECVRDYELKNYKEKKEIMNKLGHRYLLIEPGMTELEALESVL